MEAQSHFNQGLELKAKGQTDAALTYFRRAVIADPTLTKAQMEIGLICREKAKTDKMFFRYAFEAFRQAARLDPTNEEAHNQYIMAAQKMGQMDNLLDEYAALTKQFPENELLKKSHKNIMALMMAMIPQSVSIANDGSSKRIRKLFFVFSMLAILSAIGLFIAPPILLKSGKIQKESVSGLIKLGFVFGVIGVGGFVARSRID